MMAERAIARETCDALSEKSIRHRPESARDISHQPGLQKSETRGGAGRSWPAEGQVSGGVAMLSVQACRQPSCFHAKAAQAPFVLDSAPGGMLYGAGLLWPHPTFQLCPHPRAQLHEEPSGETGATVAGARHTTMALVGSSARLARTRHGSGPVGTAEAYTRDAAARPPGSNVGRVIGAERTCSPEQLMERPTAAFAQTGWGSSEHVRQTHLIIIPCIQVTSNSDHSRTEQQGKVITNGIDLLLKETPSKQRFGHLAGRGADIMISIIERIRERVQKGARTFMVKVKAHRGEPLNEKADTQAENARQLQDDCRQWTVRTPSMTYEWSDSNGVKRTTAWSKAVRKAMVRGGAEYQVQEATNHAVTNWRKTFLRDTNAGLHSISHAASKGAQGDLMSNERWGRECMLQLQEDENWNKPTTTTWAAEFLLREGESRELLGSWIRSGAVPEAKKRRAKQVITCSFPCGQWLYKIGARANPRCELCRRERETRGASIDSLPPETVAHIQSAGCNLQKKSVIGAHNRCWKYLIGAISTHGEAKRSLEVLGGDKDRQLHTLWKETKIGEILPWEDIEEEAEELIARSRVERRASASNQANQQREDESGGDEKDPSEEVIFGQRRPDSLAIDWTNKMVYVLEFKRTSDQRRDYREKAESRARAQHDVLIRSLEKVAGETESEGERWKVKLIVFVGGTCGSVHVQTFNCNLKELGVLESKRGAIRKGLVQELLYAQDTVLCSYFAQREGATNGDKGRRSTAAEVFQGLDRFG
jgi:hypothetical protein